MYKVFSVNKVLPGIVRELREIRERSENNLRLYINENHDIAIAMSSSCSDPLLGINILSYCTGWGYLNI